MLQGCPLVSSGLEVGEVTLDELVFRLLEFVQLVTAEANDVVAHVE
jgi:hypothetical protein